MTSKPNYPEAVERVPEVFPGHWSTPEGLEKAREYALKERSELCRGSLPDFALANAIYMADRTDLDLIHYQTAAKERIRWLSVQVALLTAEKDGLASVNGQLTVELDAERYNTAHAHQLRAAAEAQVTALLNAKEAAEGEMERLRGAVINLSDALAVSDDRLDVAEAKLSTLEKALEWYGDAANYIPDGKHWTTNTDLDKGDRARQALSNLPKSGGVLEAAAADDDRGAGEIDKEELTDLISDAIADSVDMDWNSRDGARAVVAALVKDGVVRVKQ